MKKEILKAKRKDNGEWVYWNIFGELCRKSGKRTRVVNKKGSTTSYYDYIHQIYQLIDMDTICRYTGFTDKNGNMIWENDIIGYWDTYSTENGLAEADCIGKVFWDDETLSFQVTERLSAESYEVMDECSVIGNIFDNPELISN